MALSEKQKKYTADLTEVVPVLIVVEGKREIFCLLVLFAFPIRQLQYNHSGKIRACSAKRRWNFTLLSSILLKAGEN